MKKNCAVAVSLICLIITLSLSNVYAQEPNNEGLSIFEEEDRIKGSFYIEDNEFHPSRNISVITAPPDPEAARYVGGGHAILDDEPKLSCIENENAQCIEGHSSFHGKYYEVRNEQELNLLFDYNFKTTAQLTAWGMTGKSEIERQIKLDTDFSSDKIVIIGRYIYNHAKCILDTATMTPEAKLLYDNKYNEFQYKYGDAYAEETAIGDAFYIVYEYDFLSDRKYVHSKLRHYAELKYKDIAEGSVEQNVVTEAEHILKSTKITSRTYATGGFVAGAINSRETFVQNVDNFSNFVQNKVTGSFDVPFTIFASKFQPYEKILNQIHEDKLSPFYLKKMEWLKLRARVNIVFKDAERSQDLELQKKCVAAVDEIDKEVDKCIASDLTAIYPTGNEYPNIFRKWLYLASNTIYEVYAPDETWCTNWKAYPWKCRARRPRFIRSNYYIISQNLTDFDRQLKNIRSRTGKNYKLNDSIGHILQTRVPGTIPLYVLEKNSGGTLFYTTNKNEWHKLKANDGFKELERGAIAGYIYENHVESTSPLASVSSDADIYNCEELKSPFPHPDPIPDTIPHPQPPPKPTIKERPSNLVCALDDAVLNQLISNSPHRFDYRKKKYWGYYGSMSYHSKKTLGYILNKQPLY